MSAIFTKDFIKPHLMLCFPRSRSGEKVRKPPARDSRDKDYVEAKKKRRVFEKSAPTLQREKLHRDSKRVTSELSVARGARGTLEGAKHVGKGGGRN